MRITNGFFGNTMLHSLQKSNGKVADLMSQISSGYRVQRPSDDPIAAVRLLLLDRDQTMIGQYRSNIGSLGIRMQQNELRLDSMLRSVHSAHDLMIRAIDGSNTPEDLNAMAGSLRTLRDNLLTEVNATDNEGNYLFSGTKTDTPAISYDPDAPLGSRYTFTGNTDQQQVVIGQGVTEAANVTADDMADIFNQLDQALAVLEDPNVDVNDPATRTMLTACLDAMNHGIGTLSTKIAVLGGAQTTLTLMDETHAAMAVSNGQAAQMLGELDYAEAYDRLNNYVIAVQGSYQVYSRVMQLSPFDVILR
ncbi:flagellar hook-associated protein 3 [Dyella sp. M7H15-1]|uniref:flagellar hook-associated protein FlgL n=1 Tax=Dyella sp. M7H15-1 TaxID=2501295 RepID=UPI001004FB26|nr:flagellar hook-associated protein FlgL [Dyella sp. M7H15-1]QAU23980.1 flagellar hook-associated protein 3 [Dyella sp. M7H15-1]